MTCNTLAMSVITLYALTVATLYLGKGIEEGMGNIQYPLTLTATTALLCANIAYTFATAVYILWG